MKRPAFIPSGHWKKHFSAAFLQPTHTAYINANLFLPFFPPLGIVRCYSGKKKCRCRSRQDRWNSEGRLEFLQTCEHGGVTQGGTSWSPKQDGHS